MESAMVDAVAEVVRLISQDAVDDAIALCPDSEVTGTGLRRSLEDYGKGLVVPPRGWESSIDAIPVAHARVPTWSVVVPLWTEEGASDLSVELTVETRPNGIVVHIDNVHVR